MKNVVLAVTLIVAVALPGGMLWAADGGTKPVIGLSQLKDTPGVSAPVAFTSSPSLGGTKPVQKFLQRAPKPTLSVSRLRVEPASASSGTKPLVRFYKKG